MRAEYAADVTRRYSTFIKVPAGVRILKSASGPSDEDYHWMEVMMRDAAGRFDAIGLHYYTITHSWQRKGSATAFDEAEYAKTLATTIRIDDIITKHSAIMDKYDPRKRVWLALDEWGTWWDVEPGTNPGFLFQQNTLRDALVAALNFNIFVKHADRLKLANIAQMINVLQAMILTKDEKMVLTPTYHVFKMYLPFQDATFVPVRLDAGTFTQSGIALPRVDAIAARDTSGKLWVAITNLDPARGVTIDAAFTGATAKTAEGSVLTAPRVDSVNSFDKPDAVTPRAYSTKARGGKLSLELPAKSIMVVRVES
jgi:alpha-N-arabinofuranosidase